MLPPAQPGAAGRQGEPLFWASRAAKQLPAQSQPEPAQAMFCVAKISEPPDSSKPPKYNTKHCVKSPSAILSV